MQPNQQQGPKDQSQQEFINRDKKLLFQTLTKRIRYSEQTYDEEDFKVDLVLRYGIPEGKERYILRSRKPLIQEIFTSIPQKYIQAYTIASQYIDFLVQKNEEVKELSHLYTRNCTCFELIADEEQSEMSSQSDYDYIEKSELYGVGTERELNKSKVSKSRPIEFSTKKAIIDDPYEDILQFHCHYRYVPILDHFTLNYNIIMIILQDLHGFKVKTYLLQDHDGRKAVYFLISTSLDKQKQLADFYQLKKEVVMQKIDFQINQPMDEFFRPYSFNSDINMQKWFSALTKLIPRTMKLHFHALRQVVYQEAKLEQAELQKYLLYKMQMVERVTLLMRESQEEQLQVAEREYLYKVNGNKMNKGCLEYFKGLKLRVSIFNAIIEANKKYGYKYHRYDSHFEQFQLPPKHKSYFQRLQSLLIYKYIKVSPFGQLALFNKMERIKLAYNVIQTVFNFQQYARINIDLEAFSLNDDFQKYGHKTYEHMKEDDQKEQSVFGGLDGKTLCDGWSAFLPFRSDIRCIRDYFGEVVALNISAKIYIISYIFSIICFSVINQLFISKDLQNSDVEPRKLFPYQLIHFGFIIISMGIFIEFWKIHERKFIQYYQNQNDNTSYNDLFVGPYYRNLENDEMNSFKTNDRVLYSIFQMRWFVIILILVGLQFLFFYYIRVLLLANYRSFIRFSLRYISIPHITFYGIFFVVNTAFSHFLYYRIVAFIVYKLNFSTENEEEAAKRLYMYMFEFSFELVGPLFLMVIEPLQKTSCYNSACIDQLLSYVYARFAILVLFFLLRIRKIILIFYETQIAPKKNSIEEQNKEKSIYFSLRFDNFLRHVQKQYEKPIIKPDYLIEESISLVFLSLYSIFFPIFAIVSGVTFYMSYIMYRYVILKSKRRTLALSTRLLEYSRIFIFIRRLIAFMSLWIIIFANRLLEYEVRENLAIFLKEYTKQNIQIMNFITFLLAFLLVEMLFWLVGIIVQYFLHDQLQGRKSAIYKKIKNRIIASSNRHEKDHLKKKPIVSISRTFSHQSLVAKQQTYKLLFQEKNRKRRLRSSNQRDIDNPQSLAQDIFHFYQQKCTSKQQKQTMKSKKSSQSKKSQKKQSQQKSKQSAGKTISSRSKGYASQKQSGKSYKLKSLEDGYMQNGLKQEAQAQ